MGSDAAGTRRLTGTQILVEYLDHPDAVRPVVQRALAHGGPALVAVNVGREAEHALDRTGWWDAPVPEFHPEQHASQLAGRAEEQHR